jgi:hypothetical protein
MRKYLWGLVIALLCMACESGKLERPDLEFVWGMRLNEPSDVSQISPNLAKLREIVMKDLMIELPLKADSLGLPIVAVNLPEDLGGLMGIYRNHLHLAFCATNSKELFPAGKPEDTDRWINQLEAEIVRNLLVIPNTKPDRVILGAEMTILKEDSKAWTDMLLRLRKQFPGTLFSIAGRIEDLEQASFATLSDELAIDYVPMAGVELKAESRAENQRIAALAAKVGKPVFVYRLNIIGPDPLIQIQNRMRFWPKDLKISGLCLNSLYPKIAARDSNSYYGLADNPEVMGYLDTYRRERDQ